MSRSSIPKKRVQNKPGFDRLSVARRLLPWGLLTLVAVTGVLWLITRALHKPTYFQIDETCACGALYTLKIDYPNHLTLDKWDIATATIVDRGSNLHLYVPFQSNATVMALQGNKEWCNLVPNTTCILQWAIKSSAPGEVVFHVLPTFKSDDPKAKPRYFRWDIRLGPVTAGISSEVLISNMAVTARNVCVALLALVGLAQAVVAIWSQPRRV